MTERMQLLQKSSRELELDNEKLAFKVSNRNNPLFIVNAPSASFGTEHVL